MMYYCDFDMMQKKKPNHHFPFNAIIFKVSIKMSLDITKFFNFL